MIEDNKTARRTSKYEIKTKVEEKMKDSVKYDMKHQAMREGQRHPSRRIYIYHYFLIVLFNSRLLAGLLLSRFTMSDMTDAHARLLPFPQLYTIDDLSIAYILPRYRASADRKLAVYHCIHNEFAHTHSKTSFIVSQF